MFASLQGTSLATLMGLFAWKFGLCPQQKFTDYHDSSHQINSSHSSSIHFRAVSLLCFLKRLNCTQELQKTQRCLLAKPKHHPGELMRVMCIFTAFWYHLWHVSKTSLFFPKVWLYLLKCLICTHWITHWEKLAHSELKIYWTDWSDLRGFFVYESWLWNCWNA